MYAFLSGMPEEKKLAFSREAYKTLMKCDENFKRLSGSFGLGKEADMDDRFLFLYLCLEMNRTLEGKEFMDLSSYIYWMREVSFRLEPSQKSSFGVAVRPDLRQWELDGGDGRKQFHLAWEILPEHFRKWLSECFGKLPNRVDELCSLIKA